MVYYTPFSKYLRPLNPKPFTLNLLCLSTVHLACGLISSLWLPSLGFMACPGFYVRVNSGFKISVGSFSVEGLRFLGEFHV